MSEENTSDSKNVILENALDAADKKGQMLVIYLPQGSVIVDRTDLNISTAMQAIAEPTVPEVARKVVEPLVAETPVPQLQPTLQEVVQLAVAEVMRITELASKPIQKEPPAVVKAAEKSVDSAVPFPDYPAPELRKAPPHVATSQRIARRIHVRRRRKINWVSGLNTIFVAYVLLAAILPAILSSAFGMAIYAAKSAHPDVLISQGDLMVSHALPSSQLKANDVLLVRDDNSWLLDARQVTSNISNGGVSTVTTTSTGSAVAQKTYVLAKDAVSYKVTRVIPKLGYVPIVLSSTIVKVLGGLSLLILNLWVHVRRSRKQRLETIIR
jgi:hypothetical protein